MIGGNDAHLDDPAIAGGEHLDITGGGPVVYGDSVVSNLLHSTIEWNVFIKKLNKTEKYDDKCLNRIARILNLSKIKSTPTLLKALKNIYSKSPDEKIALLTKQFKLNEPLNAALNKFCMHYTAMLEQLIWNFNDARTGLGLPHDYLNDRPSYMLPSRASDSLPIPSILALVADPDKKKTFKVKIPKPLSTDRWTTDQYMKLKQLSAKLRLWKCPPRTKQVSTASLLKLLDFPMKKMIKITVALNPTMHFGTDYCKVYNQIIDILDDFKPKKMPRGTIASAQSPKAITLKAQQPQLICKYAELILKQYQALKKRLVAVEKYYLHNAKVFSKCANAISD